MSPTKVLVGQVLLVFAIVMAILSVATQWAASQLGYQPQLGTPWVSVASSLSSCPCRKPYTVG